MSSTDVKTWRIYNEVQNTENRLRWVNAIEVAEAVIGWMNRKFWN